MIHGKELTKEDALEIIKKYGDKCVVYSDDKWQYPWQGCDQKQCPMLDMNFHIERRPGIVIHIPNKILEVKS